MKLYHSIVTLGLTAVFLAGCTTDYETGKKEASEAIAEGKPLMITYGMFEVGRLSYEKALWDRGVILKDIGCDVNKPMQRHVAGVNETTEVWLKHKYGEDVIRKIAVETDIGRKAAMQATGR